jgi:eukaryotic-like serine/threonine-protein kinase
VMDFGIARAITPVNDKPGLTRVGEVVGTPEYMSPEQASGDAVDGRSDLYSLGLVAWFAMTGRTAVTGESTQRVLVKQLTEALPPLSSIRSDLPSALCDVVDQCCRKEPDDRFPTAEAVVEALDATQLATPDIPVSMRLLAPELSTVATRSVVTAVLLTLGVAMILRNSNGNVFAIAVIIAATAWVGLVTSMRDVRRLRGTGYTVAELQRLLGLTLTERDEERARRALDVGLVKRRRTRVILSTALLLWQGATLVWIIRGTRAGGDAKFEGKVALVTFFASLLGSAAAIAVLSSSPFRRSLSERLFSAVWLGPLGRMILTLAGGGEPSGAPGVNAVTNVRRPVAPTPATATLSTAPTSLASLAHDVQTLRARVDAIESRTPR